MLRSALIGHTVYVGSFLKTKLKDIDLYNSSNIDEIVGKAYDTIYFAGLPAAKWIANANPKEDLANMLRIQELLAGCETRFFILISTIDVYDKNVSGQDETGSAFTKEPYGAHRRMMEEWVIRRFPGLHCILRLPALFGMGLKKNMLFDMMNGRPCVVRSGDSFQWYYLDNLYSDMQICLGLDISLANLFSKPILMSDIVYQFFPDVKMEDGAVIKYHFESNYG
jgi:hypothetical protein